MKISFTGTQEGMTQWQGEELQARLTELKCSELINGGCIGADEQSIAFAINAGVSIFHFYPSNLKHKQSALASLGATEGYMDIGTDIGRTINIKIERERPALERNKLIVDESEVLIAAPKEHKHTLRSGTWATIRYAWKRKKKVIIIPPIVREDDNGKEIERDSPEVA